MLNDVYSQLQRVALTTEIIIENKNETIHAQKIRIPTENDK